MSVTSVNEGQGVFLVLVDLSAAFDTVDCDILLNFMKDFVGVDETLLKFFKSCRCNRSQSVAEHVDNVSHNCTKFHSDLFPSSHVRTLLWPGQGIAVAVKCHDKLKVATVVSD